MKVSYKKMWIRMIEKEISAVELQKQTGISSGSMTKLRKGESVLLDMLSKICEVLDCNIGDVVEFI